MLRSLSLIRSRSITTVPSPSTQTVGFAYSDSLGNVPATRITRLANGFTVATEANPNHSTATVGVFTSAGSRFETAETNGTANFLGHMLLKGTKTRTQLDLETQIESMGGHLNAYTSREHSAFFAKTMAADVPKAVDILSDILQSSTFDQAIINSERTTILKELAELDNNKESVVFDHLHSIAFQGRSLGMTTFGPADNIKNITRDDLVNFAKENHTADRMVLAAAGAVDHDALVKQAETHFGSLARGSGIQPPKALFTGSDLRARFDTYPVAHIIMAVEGASLTSPDYWPLQVAQAITGTWDRAMGAASHTSSPLAQILSAQPYKSLGFLANSYNAFNTSYTDTGLFGIHAVTDNFTHIDDLVHHIQREWHRLALNLTEAEVFRAKNQLKTSLFLSLADGGNGTVCQDIGRQMLSYGKRLSPWEIDGLIEGVKSKDVMRVAGEYLYDREVAVVGYGPVEGLQDYNRIRAAMSPVYY